MLISYDQYRQLVAGNSNDVLARIARLLARMARENGAHADEEGEADVQEVTRDLRRRKRA